MAGSVDGLISGLDTSGIISQLMQLERIPVDRLEQKRTQAAAVATAYQQLNTKFAALQSSADKLTQADFWQGRRATSSSANVVVAASPGALSGAFTFDVEQVASAQSYISQQTFSSTSAPVSSATGLTLTKGEADPVVIDVGDGSLASVVSGINAAKAGVRAAATQVSPGVYRLQLTSTTTGVGSDFALSSDGPDPLGGLDELTAGRDARIAVGEVGSPGRYTVTSPTNTLADVMPGVTLTVKAPVTGVTVDVNPDSEAISAQVESMVKAANSLLTEIKTMTAYDPATKKGGILVGDSTARSLQQEVLRLTSSTVGSAAAAGVQLERNGTISFDKVKFSTAYEADPVATERLFRPHGTTTPPVGGIAGLAEAVSLIFAGDRTTPGQYDVAITQAATRAAAVVTGAPGVGDQLTVTVPGKPPVVVTAASSDLAAFAALVNEQAAAASLGLVARVESGSLVVRATDYGSKPAFTLGATGSLVAGPTAAGTDVAGTIGGVVAEGVGQLLSAPIDHPSLRGLSLRVTATVAQVTDSAAQANLFGTFGYSPGLAQRLDSLAGDVIRTEDGRLTSAIAGRDRVMKSLAEEIDSWDVRLELREKALRRQYSNLEVALGKMREQSSWLASQLGNLSANNG